MKKIQGKEEKKKDENYLKEIYFNNLLRYYDETIKKATSIYFENARRKT